MNIKSITLIVFFTISSLLANAQFEAGLLNTLEAVYPDSNNVKLKNTFTTNIAKNTAAEVHILVKSEIGNLISFSTQSKNISNVNLSVIEPVPVEQNTGIDSRTEQFLGVLNPHVIRRAPFDVFEIIYPLEERRIKTKYRYSLIRLTIDPENFKSNKDYVINISISDKLKNLKKLKFKIKVHSVLIPNLIDSNFFYTNWFNMQKMEEKHDLKRWSKKWYKMLDKYAQIMAKGRQNCIIIPKELISLKNNKIILDEKKMISFIEIFKKHGFTYFESPHLLGRGENDNWGNPELITSLRKKGYYSSEGKKEIDTIIHKIKKFTLKYNLKNQWLQHISDEPTDVSAKCYQDAAKQIKSIYPEIKIMEATNAMESLSGSIDLWCPLINDFQENEEFFRNREKEGEKILIYTCLVPGGKWLNRTLDMERIRQVYFGWAGSKYNTFGYLHWGLNQYKANPFTQSVVKHPSPAASSNNYLPAGDTHIIYPGKNGPLSSLRFESQRLGIEDYEILEILKSINPSKHSRFIKKLFINYTDYSLSINKYMRIKRRVLKSI
ncbi:DUF4091 domain-containing protein [Flavobacteriaceae bacterium]|nr:DUF4091 domain-containing protein [Flavobacteriaceae bacterium]MDB4113685.1 DUF4091 domain-containing protein [Flavobacteriaceae bacterium]